MPFYIVAYAITRVHDLTVTHIKEPAWSCMAKVIGVITFEILQNVGLHAYGFIKLYLDSVCHTEKMLQCPVKMN